MSIAARTSRKKLGQKIRKTRKDQGISQLQLAFESGITRESVSQIESGKTNLTHDTLFAIAASLDISIHDLFDFE